MRCCQTERAGDAFLMTRSKGFALIRLLVRLLLNRASFPDDRRRTFHPRDPQMLRTATAIAILATFNALPSSAEDGEYTACHLCDADVSTLRLYFSTDDVGAEHNPGGFKPEVAKLYVDEIYVGDAIVNLQGYVPTLRFPKSTLKLRVEMSNNRTFETKMTFLGQGSTQVLYVDFSKTNHRAAALRR